ncbi:FAR1-related sequence 5-like protein [Tanacetum coccineum]
MDATYKTNRFNMPFLEIIGVSSTNLTFYVAFAFLCKEKQDNYEWALNCLKSTLDERVCPCVVVTDRAYALMNACKTVFPDAKQLLCRWHISQSVFKFARPSMKSPELWDSLDTAWKSIVLSSTVTSYLRNYAHLEAILTEFPGQPIPFESIDVFWKKLDLSPSIFINDDELCCKIDVEKFEKAFKKQSTFGNHVNSIQNVRSDGNYGFRAVSACLNLHEDSWPQVRLDLWNELNEHEEYYTYIFRSKDVSNIYRSLNFTGPGPTPEENWMVMPDTGLLIASRYNRVVQYLNICGSNTMFPLWSSPPESQRHESIVIVLVHGMHFVRVDLGGDYPMPYVLPY